jgi:outer membrane protein
MATVGGAGAADLAPASGVLPQPDTDWTITVGVEGRVEPLFQGSSRETALPYPIFDARRAGTPERFHAPRDGIGIGLLEWNNFQAGPVGVIRRNRKESDDWALRGLGDIRATVELGAFAEYWWAPWLRTRGEVRQGFGGHDGVVADLFLDAVVPVTPHLVLSGGPRATFATTAATSPYFSISPIQSAFSGLPVFDARGGLHSFGAGTQARYHWTPAWATHVFVEYERLTGDAAGSPLVVQRGSADQVTVGAGVSYSFDIKKFW